MPSLFRSFIAASLVLAMAAPSSLAQELTPEQRLFMGLPASGPLSTGPAPVIGPRFSKPAPSIPRGGSFAELTKTDAAGLAMTFKLVSNGGVSCCEWIAADGTITSATPQAFNDFTIGLGQVAPTLQLKVTFNSPGGDFFAALAPGREIRRDTHLWTAVGRTEVLPDVDPRRAEGLPGG